MEFIEIEGQKSEPVIGRPCGQLVKASTLLFKKKKDAAIRIQGGSSSGNSRLFERGFNFQAMGIGGLDKEFADIFRRAFASRVFPPEVLRKMGIKHVRGMLLYGPPGCGKTLIARQIGKALNAHEPKVVNGPEILNKYVGESEANIRALFEDAEKEQEEMGDNSDLHIIIFDEIDAICKSRGANGDGSSVGSQGMTGRHGRPTGKTSSTPRCCVRGAWRCTSRSACRRTRAACRSCPSTRARCAATATSPTTWTSTRWRS